jgi:hypothetical protein
VTHHTPLLLLLLLLLLQSFLRLGKDHVGRTAPTQPPAAAAAAGADVGTDAAAAAGDTAEAGDAQPAAAAAGGSSKAPSIADMLKAEVADLKKERVHRFRRHNTDVRGTVFIEFPKVDGESCSRVGTCLGARGCMRL